MIKTLAIRQATERDLKNILMFELRNRKWFSQFLPEKMLRKQTEEYFKYLLRGKFKHLQYLVTLPTGELIGRFSGQIIDSKQHSLEVSYRIAKDFSNRGIARYALKRLLALWACYGIKHVYAQVSDHNSASIKVLMSCGFQMSELQKNSINFESIIHDSLIFKWVSNNDISYRIPTAELHEVLTN